jgi:hypothetical protein
MFKSFTKCKTFKTTFVIITKIEDNLCVNFPQK